MNDKFRYIFKRMISAGIDLIIFALLGKLLEPITRCKNEDGNYYTPIGVVVLIYYLFFLFQDFFFNKTIGKYLLKFEIKTLEGFSVKQSTRIFRLFLRRFFDLLDLICPFFYILFIIFNSKNQKLGDYVSEMLVTEKKV